MLNMKQKQFVYIAWKYQIRLYELYKQLDGNGFSSDSDYFVQSTNELEIVSNLLVL